MCLFDGAWVCLHDGVCVCARRVWDAAEYTVTAIATARRGQEGGVCPQCLAFADVLLSGWSDGK